MSEEKKSKTILDNLLNADFEFINERGEKFEVSPKGSLGLLASGYKGLVAVRKKRKQLKSLNKSS